ncbi:MAG: hypothetical protein IPL79_03515 [Myxococcales bacterium]|nr:hypothetical protein [Myxococcales bacterium]
MTHTKSINAAALTIALAMTFGCQSSPAPKSPASLDAAAAQITAYIDKRFDATPADREALLADLQALAINATELEELIRRPPSSLVPAAWAPGTITGENAISCFHVDYDSVYYARMPAGASSSPLPVLVVGHGGNSSMDAGFARSTALSYAQAYAPLADALGAVLVAPASERGWSPIGDSLILSVLSELQRRVAIDPDRIYLTGQSMGGHLAWRSTVNFSDTYAAFLPMSGGYPEWADGKNETLYNAWDTVGYHTWGESEIYDLDLTNEAIAEFLTQHGYAWHGESAAGEHPIATDKFDAIVAAIGEVSRQLYAPTLYFRGGGAMQYVANWDIESWPEHTISATRPLMYNSHRFVRLGVRDDDLTKVQYIRGRVQPGNIIELTTQEVRRLTVMLHPDLGIDLATPVTIKVNGAVAFTGVVAPDLGRMLDLVREYDDRGRIFHGFVDLDVDTDAIVGPPWQAE